jgi:hypothetical protein
MNTFEFQEIIDGPRTMFSWSVMNEFDNLSGKEEEYIDKLYSANCKIKRANKNLKDAMKTDIENVLIYQNKAISAVNYFISLLRSDHCTFIKNMPKEFYTSYEKIIEFKNKY